MGPLEDFSLLVGPLEELGLLVGPLEDFSLLVGPLLLKRRVSPGGGFLDASGTAWTPARWVRWEDFSLLVGPLLLKRRVSPGGGFLDASGRGNKSRNPQNVTGYDLNGSARGLFAVSGPAAIEKARFAWGWISRCIRYGLGAS